MNRIFLIAIIATLAVTASAAIIEQWDYTGNSLVGGVNGTNMTFVNAGGNVDQTGGAYDNTYTVNRSGGFGGNVMAGLNIGLFNTSTLTVSFSIASWDLTRSGSNGYWGIRLRQADNSPVAELRFAADATGGTKIVLDGEYGQITDSGLVDRTAAIGGLVSAGQASATPLTVSLTLDLVNSTYALESTAWFNKYVSQSTGTIAGLSGAVIDNFTWAWTQINDTPVTAAPNGDFIELDQIRIETTPVPEPTTFALVGLGVLGLWLAGRRQREFADSLN